jgi:hypothetical protein
MTEAKELEDRISKVKLEDQISPTREKELEDRISKLIHFVNSLIDDIKFSFEVCIAEYEVLREECSEGNIAN